MQLGQGLSSVGMILVFFGILIVILGFLLVSCQPESTERRTETKSSGVVFIGPIPLAWGVSSRTYSFIIVIGLVILLLWLYFFIG